jgi:hypothetical protein
MTNHKRRVEDFSIEQLDAGDFKVHHKSSSPIAQDNQIEKHDAMSFDAYQDPKVVNDLADDTDSIPKHIADHYEAMDEDLAGNAIASPGGLSELLKTTETFDPASIDHTLAERGSNYGDFAEQCRVTRNIKRAMADSKNWDGLPDDMKEALDMTAVKIGRILNGEPTYHDSWHDIIGYIKLVADKLLEKISG